MPAQYSPRRAPCSGCGDVVLIVEESMGRLFGKLVGKPRLRLEHADPEPHGETFDEVDEGCRRPRVAG